MFTEIGITSASTENAQNPANAVYVAKNAGFTVTELDLYPWALDEFPTDDDVAALTRAREETGMRMTTAHAYFTFANEIASLDAGIRERVRKRYEREIDLIAHLGIKNLVIHLKHLVLPERYAETLANAKEEVERLLSYIGTREITLAFENLPEPRSVALMLDLVRAFPNEPRVGICFDSGHTLLGGYALEILTEFRDRIVAVHLHDNFGFADRHLLPFAGAFDWGAAYPLLNRANVPVLLLEVKRPKGVYDTNEAYLAHAYETGRALLDETYHTKQAKETARLYDVASTAYHALRQNASKTEKTFLLDGAPHPLYEVARETYTAWCADAYAARTPPFTVEEGDRVFLSREIPVREGGTFACTCEVVAEGEEPWFLAFLALDEEGNALSRRDVGYSDAIAKDGARKTLFFTRTILGGMVRNVVFLLREIKPAEGALSVSSITVTR